MELVAGAFMGAFLGGVLSVILTVWVERLRSPRLKLSIEDPRIEFRMNGPVYVFRAVRIYVSNEPLGQWANWWMLRAPAQQCQADIVFRRLDGTKIFPQSMVGRWARSPEPAVIHVASSDGKTAPMVANSSALKTAVDIYPGENEFLDVAVRFDNDDECYAWNNDSYLFSNWRNPDRRFSSKVYLVEITVTSSGKKCTDYFRLNNDGPCDAFLLGPATLEDRQRLKKFVN